MRTGESGKEPKLCLVCMKPSHLGKLLSKSQFIKRGVGAARRDWLSRGYESLVDRPRPGASQDQTARVGPHARTSAANTEHRAVAIGAARARRCSKCSYQHCGQCAAGCGFDLEAHEPLVKKDVTKRSSGEPSKKLSNESAGRNR